MKTPQQLDVSHKPRLKHVVDQSWLILKSRFLQKRHDIPLEAPFQHYFAHILSAYGDLCCTGRDDLFLVDLECKMAGNAQSREYLDIGCSFAGRAKCAIELKFKTAKQGAQDHGRIDAYQDIEALERACRSGYDFGRFYMITDSSVYVTAPRGIVGRVFDTHDGHQTVAGDTFHCPQCAGRSSVCLTLTNSYAFQWETIGQFHFLEVHVY
jgi:hypothetical protein